MYVRHSICVLLYVNFGLDCWNNTPTHPVFKRGDEEYASIGSFFGSRSTGDGDFVIDDKFKTSILELVKSFVTNATRLNDLLTRFGISAWLASRNKDRPLEGVESYPEDFENKMKVTGKKLKDYLGLTLHDRPTKDSAALKKIIQYRTTWTAVISAECSFTKSLKFLSESETFTMIFGNFIRGEIDDPKLRFIILPMDESRSTIIFVPVGTTTADNIYNNIESVVEKILKVDKVLAKTTMDTFVSLPPMKIEFSARVVALTKENTISVEAGTGDNCAPAVKLKHETNAFKIDQPFVVTMMTKNVILGAALVKKIHP